MEALKQSPEEKKECRGWFDITMAATLSMLVNAMVVNLERHGRKRGKVKEGDVLRSEFAM